MNNIQKNFEESKTASQFSRKYLNYLSTILEEIDEKAVGEFIELILTTRNIGKSIFVIGNGGNAATATHFASDIQIGTRTSGKPFKVQSLTDNLAILTAIGNDYGYDFIFVKQLEALLSDGDVVIAISASGNSQNIINAINYANQKNCTTVGLSGFDGGKLKEIVHHNLHVPSVIGEYGPVEDIHMIFSHIVGNYLMYYCRKNDN
jgi:D-sedoheptulose 7-phosphate isomerase